MNKKILLSLCVMVLFILAFTEFVVAERPKIISATSYSTNCGTWVRNSGEYLEYHFPNVPIMKTLWVNFDGILVTNQTNGGSGWSAKVKVQILLADESKLIKQMETTLYNYFRPQYKQHSKGSGYKTWGMPLPFTLDASATRSRTACNIKVRIISIGRQPDPINGQAHYAHIDGRDKHRVFLAYY